MLRGGEDEGTVLTTPLPLTKVGTTKLVKVLKGAVLEGGAKPRMVLEVVTSIGLAPMGVLSMENMLKGGELGVGIEPVGVIGGAKVNSAVVSMKVTKLLHSPLGSAVCEVVLSDGVADFEAGEVDAPIETDEENTTELDETVLV